MEFQRFLERQLQDRQFAELWEDTLPSFEAGTLLVEIRSELTLSQKALAERAGLKRSYISRLESGDANPTVRTLGRILRAVGFRLKLHKELIAGPWAILPKPPSPAASLEAAERGWALASVSQEPPQLRSAVYTGATTPSLQATNDFPIIPTIREGELVHA